LADTTKIKQAIDKAFELQRSGKRAEACLFLWECLASERDNETLWLALAILSDSQNEKINCLEQVSRINPNNTSVLKELPQWDTHDQLIELPTPSAQPRKRTRQRIGNIRWLVGSLVVFLVIGLIGVVIAWFTIGPDKIRSLLPNIAVQSGMLVPTNTLPPALPSNTATTTLTITPTATITFTPTSTITATPSQTPTPTLTPVSEDTPTPSASPTTEIPSAARIEGIEGSSQLLSLSCEANVATIWAQYYGVELDERTVQSQLPITDNPETGFVGNVNESWGQIPPKPYGVHSQPVANLLRDYGLNAMAVKDMSWDDLKLSITSGNPAIVWVPGKVWVGQPAVDYYSQDGSIVQVVPYEHTVLVTGYDEEEDIVYILDGTQTYERTVTKFLKSWETLGNLAVVWGP
jgi:uncharacterized protein YvpB